MNWKPELDDLARREAFAREMGGVDKVKRQHDQGRLTVRERIDRIVDPNSFHEVGAISGVGEYDENNELKHLTPANCVFGRGRIDDFEAQMLTSKGQKLWASLSGQRLRYVGEDALLAAIVDVTAQPMGLGSVSAMAYGVYGYNATIDPHSGRRRASRNSLLASP